MSGGDRSAGTAAAAAADAADAAAVDRSTVGRSAVKMRRRLRCELRNLLIASRRLYPSQVGADDVTASTCRHAACREDVNDS